MWITEVRCRATLMQLICWRVYAISHTIFGTLKSSLLRMIEATKGGFLV